MYFYFQLEKKSNDINFYHKAILEKFSKMEEFMKWDAKWIWLPEDCGTNYNTMLEFKKEFNVDNEIDSAELSITADSRYRVKINGVWINDGPARAYVQHYKFDRYQIGQFLQKGVNRIEGTVQFFGCGTFHQKPQRGGLLAQIILHFSDRHKTTIASDESWQIRPAAGWVSNTPKISVQQPPVEIFDATRSNQSPWQNAAVICNAESGPWQELKERDCEFMSLKKVDLKKFIGASERCNNYLYFNWSPRKILLPGSFSNNCSDCYPAAFALILEVSNASTLKFVLSGVSIYIDGKKLGEDLQICLPIGSHTMLAFQSGNWPHAKDCTVFISGTQDVKPVNPFGSNNEYSLITAPEHLRESPDIPFLWASKIHAKNTEFLAEWGKKLGESFTNTDNLFRIARGTIIQVAKNEFFCDDGFFATRELTRQPLPAQYLKNPEALLNSDTKNYTAISCHNLCSSELCYDFTRQCCGYYQLEVESEYDGTIIDLYMVEYIDDKGNIQHTYEHHNTMRYICRKGINKFVSFRRRSGRYLFVTVSNCHAPLKIHHIGMIESTYPAQSFGTFNCSDDIFNQIWQMSANTLKLCMEDTFTDCPLYEQTLWVGDARSEALFAYGIFGAYDLSRRCIKLTAESLEEFPIAGCQVPSCWECLLPAWSFMWGMSVYDYYFETGDLEFCRSVWPQAATNIIHSFAMLNSENGLFSAEAWNLFDWSPTNCAHSTMLYNSMFLYGATDAALKLAAALGENQFITEFTPKNQQLKKDIQKFYDPERKMFPDWVEKEHHCPDGAVHTSMLALLYGLDEQANREDLINNIISRRNDLIQVSSPFASFYHYLAMVKIGAPEQVLSSIHQDYAEMVRRGESTVWETYIPLDFTDGFPTRSHCHGWSAVPLYMLQELVLGIRLTAPGASKIEVSPVIANGLYRATGRRKTVNGLIEVDWHIENNTLAVNIKKPANVEVTFKRNSSMKDLAEQVTISDF